MTADSQPGRLHVIRVFDAYTQSVERILGLPNDSLVLTEPESLQSRFT